MLLNQNSMWRQINVLLAGFPKRPESLFSNSRSMMEKYQRERGAGLNYLK